MVITGYYNDSTRVCTLHVHGKLCEGKMRQTDSGNFVEEMVNQIENGTNDKYTPQLRYVLS